MEGRRNKVAYLHDEAPGARRYASRMRPIVNCTVNRGLLFGGGREERENQRVERSERRG